MVYSWIFCLKNELYRTTGYDQTLASCWGPPIPHELVEQAAAFGYSRIAVTDRNSLAGVVRAHVAAKKTGITLIPGCRLDLLDGPSLFALPNR